MADTIQARTAAARGFVRSLNILLKFARMYEFGHPRTVKQYEIAWTELRTALGSEDEAGLLLAVSADQLLIDGIPLESGPSEKSFGQMLSAAGIASIHFSPKVNQASLARFVRGFPTGTGSKPTQLAEQMKAALEGDPNIHVNEICFVPADSAVAKSTVAAQLAARTLGMNAEQTDALLNDPEKLLQLIMAAEGTKGRGAGDGSDGQGGYGSGVGYGSGGGYGQEGDYGSGSGYAYGGGHGSRSSGSDSEHGSGGNFRSGGSGAAGPNNSGQAGSGESQFDSGVIGAYSGGSLLSALGNPEFSGGTIPVGGATVEGPISTVHGSGGWNIVNSGGGGAPVEPNAGGFWLNKDLPSDKEATGRSVTGSAGRGGRAPETSGPASGTSNSSGANGADGDGAPGPNGLAAFGVSTNGGRGGWARDAAAGADPQSYVSRWIQSSSGIRVKRPARGAGKGSMAVETGLMTLHQDELQGILRVLAQVARTGDSSSEQVDPIAFQSRLSVLPRRARFTVSQALAALAAQAPSEGSDRPTLLKLAEHIAVRFALESFERGDVKVNAVRQVLDEMSLELDGLRKILGVYEEKLVRAGIPIQSHTDALAREFWSQVPEEKRKGVLESENAWCVPPLKAREYVEKLIKEGKSEEALDILRNYANCLESKSTEARKQTALGLAELTPIYAEHDEKLLTDTIRQVGVRLAEERDSELQSVLGAAFVRLSQEATKKRSYPAIQRSVEMLEFIEVERPGGGKSLGPRIAVEDKLPEFIDESLRVGEVPNGLKDLLRGMPKPSAEQIAARFCRVGFRQDCDLLVSMMELLGIEGLEHLRTRLREGDAHEAIDTVGILARMDLEQIERYLPERMREWGRSAHDRVVRQIAASGAEERGRLLLELFDSLDALIRPLAIDEIGMAGEKLAEMRLLRIAEGDIPKGSTEYLRLKAIEALGRLRTSGSETVLRRIAETRKAWRWTHASELRLVSAQALEKIDPEWVRDFLPRSGLNVAELSIESLDSDPESSAIRQRRYPRLRMEKPVSAVTTNLRENYQLEIPEMALGGGVAVCQQNLHPGSVVELKMNGTLNAIKAQSIVRDANTQARTFELVEMDLEERSKLRKLLVQLGSLQRQSRPDERSRKSTRMLIVGTQKGT
ncbi:MAG: hypothetical protein ACRD4R_06250 [Candidatus Acidiferrales bacterium]